MALQGSGRSPRRGSGRRPAAWEGVGIFRGIETMLRLSAASMLGLSANPCCAAPSSAPLLYLTTHPCRAFGAPLPFVLGEGGGGAGRRGVRGGLGGRGVAGLRAWERLRRGMGVGGAHGGGAARARGMKGVRVFSGNSIKLHFAAFLCRASRQIPAAPSSAPLLYLTAHPCRACGALLPFGSGKVAVVRGGGASGVAWGVGALRACGHGNACGTAGGGFGVFSGNSTMLRLRPISAALPRCTFGSSLP